MKKQNNLQNLVECAKFYFSLGGGRLYFSSLMNLKNLDGRSHSKLNSYCQVHCNTFLPKKQRHTDSYFESFRE